MNSTILQPSQPAPEPVATQEAIEPPSARPLKILIADDSPLAVKMMARTLSGAGYEVVSASDGIAAAQMVYSEWPDVVLLDIFMPRINGYHVCRLIKHDPLTAHIPVLINTASEPRSAEFWSLHTGADGFLLKGIAPGEIVEKIVGVLAEKWVAPPQLVPAKVPDAEEILCKVCALVDEELYATTVRGIESQAMLENLTEGIIVVDLHGEVTSANTFLCELLETESCHLVGKSCEAVLGGAFGEATRRQIDCAIETGRATSREDEAISRAGKATPVAVSAVPVDDYLGKVVAVVCMVQDITKRRQLEALNRLKNDLTDMIVHDLRTPLTALLAGMETVPLLGEMNADQSEFLQLSIDGGQVLLGLINDLLDISKMEDGSLRLTPKPLDAEGLVLRAFRQVNALAAGKEIELVADAAPDLPILQADDDKLLRTLVNLLSNAIKFTPHGGAISLGARFASRPGRRDSVVFACQDSGEGIPEAAFERIFDKFGQVEGRQSGRMMSTGLGLTFCKMVVEGHGGRIWVQSALGHGSTFSFALPVG